MNIRQIFKKIMRDKGIQQDRKLEYREPRGGTMEMKPLKPANFKKKRRRYLGKLERIARRDHHRQDIEARRRKRKAA